MCIRDRILAVLPSSLNGNTNNLKKYPYNDIDAFDWLHKDNEWTRLQIPLKKGTMTTVPQEPLTLSITNMDSIYQMFAPQQEDSQEKSMYSMSLGYSLQALSNGKTIQYFQPKIPQLASRLLNLPLYDSSLTQDELFSIDKHEYYVQLKFIPNTLVSASFDSKITYPPVELWFELDEEGHPIMDSLRCIAQLNKKSMILQTPTAPFDYAINMESYIDPVSYTHL